MSRLVALSDHVLVGTSEFCAATTTVVVADDGRCLVVDPGVHPPEITDLIAELARRGLTVAAAFATHPHWDHVLWSSDLGAAPRYATAAAAETAEARRERIVAQVEQFAPGHDTDLVARLAPLAPGATTIPWDGPRVDVVEHRAHAPGHAALVVVDDGVLLAGDMCSDIEIPLLDLAAAAPVADYRAALERFAGLDVEYVVPGHGAMGDVAELRRRIAADHEYLDALEAGGAGDDPRLTEDWLRREHRDQLTLLAGR